MRKLIAFLIALAALVGPFALNSSHAGGFLILVKPSAAWTPASLGANLVAWYKADAGVTCSGTCTNGSAITGWADQSGNGNDLVKIAFTNDSTFHSAGLGGKESVGFVSGGGMQTTTDAVTNMGTGNSSSCFVLGSVSAGSGSNALGFAASGQNTATGANSVGWIFLSSTPEFTWDHAFGSGTNVGLTADAETRMGMLIDGANNQARAYKNGTSSATDSLTTFNFTSPGTIIIGSGGASWVGEIREIIITKSVLSPADVASLDAYLVSRQ